VIVIGSSCKNLSASFITRSLSRFVIISFTLTESTWENNNGRKEVVKMKIHNI
jgi:hypothetical protein